MKHEISTIVCGLALIAAATSTGAADEAAVRASRAAWAALDKIAKERMRRDFQGGFASYWHSNIDAAREMYESVLMNGVFLNEQKVDALRQVAQMHLEATRDEEAALGAMECAFALPGLSGEEKSRAEAVKLDLLRMMRRVPPGRSKFPRSANAPQRREWWISAAGSHLLTPYGRISTRASMPDMTRSSRVCRRCSASSR